MSASDKKKLRKENNAAAITEKQQTAQKEQKKLKAYTLTFVIAMVLVVAIVLVSVLQMPVKNAMMNGTNALTVGEHQLNATEFNYFYYDAINNFYSQFSGYGDMAALYCQYYYGLNPSKALDSQALPGGEDGETWKDYFIDSASQTAKWTYAMYDLSVKEEFKLSEDQQKSLDSLESMLPLYAAYDGYSDVKTWLKANYGSSATVETFLEYNKIDVVARAFANNYVEGLKFEDKDFREYEADKYGEFCSYSWYSHYIVVNDYLEGGTEVKGEDGKTTVTYSDEEKAAALAAAKADAEKLVASGALNLEDLNTAINALEINKPNLDDKDKKDPVEAVENEAVLYSSTTMQNLYEDVKKWLTDDERKEGDLTFIERTTGTDDDKTTIGFFVLLFTERIDNKINVGSVRHLLVKFEGGTKDEEANKTVYSDEEKAAAKAEAEKLLKQFQEGEKVDEDAFIELVKKHSDDTSKTTGGLFEDITPDSGYVDSFTEWAQGDHEKGDVEIIESEYGYHIMYYVEKNELNYRDMLINNAMIEENYTEWEEGVLKDITVTEGDMKYVKGNVIIAG